MCVAALFIGTKQQEPSKCPSNDEWTDSNRAHSNMQWNII